MIVKKTINNIFKAFSFIENERFVISQFDKHKQFGAILSGIATARNIYFYICDSFYKDCFVIEGNESVSLITEALINSKEFLGEIEIPNPPGMYASKNTKEYLHKKIQAVLGYDKGQATLRVISNDSLSKKEIEFFIKKLVGEHVTNKYGKLVSVKKGERVFSSFENKFQPCEIELIHIKEIAYCLNQDLGRSFLFHGRPGTGKSNYIKNIISHFDKGALNLFNISEMSCMSILETCKLIDYPFIILDDLDHHSFNNAEIFNLIDRLKEMGKIILSSANVLGELPQPLLRTGRFDRLTEFDKLKHEAIKKLTNEDEELMQELQYKTASEIEEFMFRVKLHGKEKAFEEKDEIFDREKLSKKQLKLMSNSFINMDLINVE